MSTRSAFFAIFLPLCLKTRRGSPWWGSNSRPHPYQGCALPLSYMGQRLRFYQTRPGAPSAVVGAGFEPAYDFRRTVLQTVAINHSATPPGASLCILGHAEDNGHLPKGGRLQDLARSAE